MGKAKTCFFKEESQDLWVVDDMLLLRNFLCNIITFWSSQGDLSSKKSKKTEEKGQDKNVAHLV